jgi:hypothetical protein
MFSARNGAVAGVGVGGTPANGGGSLRKAERQGAGTRLTHNLASVGVLQAGVYEAIARPSRERGSNRRFSKTLYSACRQSVKPATRSEKPGAVESGRFGSLADTGIGYELLSESPYAMQALTSKFRPDNAGLTENGADGFSVEKRPQPGREISRLVVGPRRRGAATGDIQFLIAHVEIGFTLDFSCPHSNNDFAGRGVCRKRKSSGPIIVCKNRRPPISVCSHVLGRAVRKSKLDLKASPSRDCRLVADERGES